MAARGLPSPAAVLPSPVAMNSSLGPQGRGSNCEAESLGSSCSSASSAASQSANGKYYNPVVMDIIREDWIQQQLQQRQASYTEFRPTRVVTGTWNVNAKKPLGPSEASKIVHWLHPPTTESRREPPDIVALGFQEIVDLNAVNVVVNSAMTVQRSSAWEEAMLTALNRYIGAPAGSSDTSVQYRVVLEKHLVGILLLVFVRTDHWDHVKEIKGATAGVGIMGVMGNKGGAAVRLKFYSSTLCFVCAHLAAHRENVAGRNADYLNIMSKIQFEESVEDGTTAPVQDLSGRFWSGEPSILNHDFVFWIGDLNYRIQDSLTTEEVFRLAESGHSLNELQQHDQLTNERRAGRVLRGFEEGPLAFPPTYKFQAGTSEYEKRPEKKLRAPAWCDRVLWRAKTPTDVKLRCYSSVPVLDLSDHKPVHALFDIQVKDQVESKKNDVIREIMMQLDKWENENMPKVRLLQEDSSTASSGVFSFSQLIYGVEQKKKVIIENTGLVVAHFRFIPKLEDVAVCKSWLNVAPMFGMIPPREKMEICITALVDVNVAHGLTSGEESLDDTMILRVENGRDYFLVVSGQYANSCFGSSLEQLVSCSEPIRHAKFTAARSPAASVFSVWVGGATVPKELWRMVNDIYENYMHEKNLFVEAGSKAEILQLREALDTGSPFPEHSGYSTAELLVRWLQALRQSVVPDEALAAAVASANGNMAQGCRALLDGLPPVRYNVVVYLVAFLREVIKHNATNKLSPEKLAFVFGRCLVSPCRRTTGKDANVGRVLALDEHKQPNSQSSTTSTVSSVGSNQSGILIPPKSGPPEERLRRDAHEFEVAQANAAQRAEKMDKFLLHFLSMP
ncbi:inositol polyphosphate 5-phosphatase, putative [Phytophthora infestans T30-4]|uniref:Inositol polyphosphate 5-phosphatase, putative n=1 Tax=Phytophthora infestans (strain T30-4) TaxID=403677 RepID=D0NJU9_PHYIT|nr:inositol polyphosphate 5-phosphatase, putative [Phytophthora infestans T30-4]EEY59786.1 inositol polyphosphate 5-phosphatase, putative [Phytophthora infestans T30-4]|eukprot:XP_002900471.1 inositol polyphosphate 5-phosphatase, putative [Phytophthora infestans T30-4]